jgi:ESCRT-II complex subunit VPS36
MFSSSPKITLLLGDAEKIISENGKGKEEEEEGGGGERNWVCRVCGMSNDIAGGTIGKCGLCGVIRQSSNNKIVPKSVATTPIDNLSLPPSRTATPTPSFVTSTPIAIPTTAPIIDNEKRIVCPVCTFLNHGSMAACEVCDTSLGSNAPVPRPRSASSSSSIGGGSAINDSVKLSFRKGGEKAFYTALKLVLIQKEWEQRAEEGANLVKPQARKAAAGIGEFFSSCSIFCEHC